MSSDTSTDDEYTPAFSDVLSSFECFPDDVAGNWCRVTVVAVQADFTCFIISLCFSSSACGSSINRAFQVSGNEHTHTQTCLFSMMIPYSRFFLCEFHTRVPPFGHPLITAEQKHAPLSFSNSTHEILNKRISCLFLSNVLNVISMMVDYQCIKHSAHFLLSFYAYSPKSSRWVSGVGGR